MWSLNTFFSPATLKVWLNFISSKLLDWPQNVAIYKIDFYLLREAPKNHIVCCSGSRLSFELLTLDLSAW